MKEGLHVWVGGGVCMCVFVHPCMREYVCVDMCMCLHVHLIIWLKSRKEGRERETKACVQHMWS